MWIYPLFISLILIAGLWTIQRQDALRSKRANHRYYRRHQGLLEDLDRIRRGLIAVFSAVTSEPIQIEAFETYERLVTDFERLLVSMRSLPTASPNLQLLNAAETLADSLQVRLAALGRTIAQGKSGKMANSKIGRPMDGCYFCSKPAITEPLRRIRIKIDGNFKQVLSCSMCRGAVKLHRTAKVLFFVKDGKSVHWSESPDYRPDESYFQINSPNGKELGRSQLRLVYSTVDEQPEARD